MVDVAVITVNYRMRDRVPTMLRSLLDDVRGSGLTVQPVVVDNSPGDGIAAVLAGESAGTERPPMVINAGANLGFGRGNNLGIRSITARYYFLANPDLTFPATGTSTVAQLHAFMEERPWAGIVAPRLERPDGTLQPSCMRFPWFLDHPVYRLGLHERYAWARRRVERLHMVDVDHRATRPIDWATGAALFIRGSALHAVGGFDERYFMYFEDCDLCRMFWANGCPVYYKGDVVVRHEHERSSARVAGLKSIIVNPLTRAHIKSLAQYAWKWRGRGV